MLAALALFLFGGKEAWASPLAVDFATPPSVAPIGSTYNLGFSFTVNTNVTVTALGNVDLTAIGGASYTQPQQVGLWNSSGTLLASTYVTSSDPLTNSFWRFNAITPVNLIAGQTYTVGGQGGADYAAGVPIVVNPNITFVSDEYAYTGSLNNPLVEPIYSSGLTQLNGAAWFGGNLLLEPTPTPEPSTLVMATLASAAYGGMTWWRRRKVSVV
jgi:hypothetical protein